MTNVCNVLVTELRDLLYNQYIDNTGCYSFSIHPNGQIRVCKIRFVSTSENRGKPCLVCKNKTFSHVCKGRLSAMLLSSDFKSVIIYTCPFLNLGRIKRIWYLSPMRAAKVQASLRIRAVSPEPSLLAHTSSGSRGTFRQKARSQAPLYGWACAVEICQDGMLEDTNSLDAAHLVLKKLL